MTTMKMVIRALGFEALGMEKLAAHVGEADPEALFAKLHEYPTLFSFAANGRVSLLQGLAQDKAIARAIALGINVDAALLN